MQKQQQGKQLKHKKINFKSINWGNLLLWSLLIVSFILAIVAVSKSGKQGPPGPAGTPGTSGTSDQPDIKQWLNDNKSTAQGIILTDVNTIEFANDAGKIRTNEGNIDMDLGNKFFSINGKVGKAWFHFADGDGSVGDPNRDFFRVQGCGRNNYFYINKNACDDPISGCNNSNNSDKDACPHTQ